MEAPNDRPRNKIKNIFYIK